MSVDPANIRLIPAKDDPYYWQSLPGKSYLFDKHLSKLSIGPLMELCREVGTSFWAVTPSVEKSTNSAAREKSPQKQKTMPHHEAFKATHELRKRLKVFQRERRRLRRQNEMQKTLISRYRSIMGSFLKDSSFTLEY